MREEFHFILFYKNNRAILSCRNAMAYVLLLVFLSCIIQLACRISCMRCQTFHLYLQESLALIIPCLNLGTCVFFFFPLPTAAKKDASRIVASFCT